MVQISATSRWNPEITHAVRAVITDWIVRFSADEGSTSVEGKPFKDEGQTALFKDPVPTAL
jgi:hypothetical protein